MKDFSGSYRGRRVLVTGHTGFKGSWLSLWLQKLGANVTGLALEPESFPNHWDLLHLDMQSQVLDIRDRAALEKAVRAANPEIIFHLAAQPLVRRSYLDPVATWQTNVMGTVNLLEASRGLPELRAIVVATTDKCYENGESEQAYRESDPLGGHDPYSASKAAAELAAASYRRSFMAVNGAPLLATARAGNVIGGGDWSEDRLVPDLVRAVHEGRKLEIRHPRATRPWQHVLDSLNGYLLLGQSLLSGRAELCGAWNFGSDAASNRTVAEVLAAMQVHWPELEWEPAKQAQPHEATLLRLDSGKAMRQLGWKSVWKLEDSLEATCQWYRRYYQRQEIASEDQLDAYCKALAQDASYASCT